MSALIVLEVAVLIFLGAQTAQPGTQTASRTLMLLLLGVLVALPFPVLSIVAARRAFVRQPTVPAWTAMLGGVELGIAVLIALTVVRDVSYRDRLLGQAAWSPAAIWGSVWPLVLPGVFMVVLGLSTLLVALSRLVRPRVEPPAAVPLL